MLPNRILVLALLAVLAAPALGEDAPAVQADPAALEFLASLGDEPDARVLGEVTMVLFDGTMPVGESTYRIGSESAGGRACYRFEMKLSMGIEGGPRNSMSAWAIVTPRLETLASESREEQVFGEKKLTRVVTSKREGGTITVTRTENGETKSWTAEACEGLIDSGGEPLLLALLGLSARAEGPMTFVTRQQDCFLALAVTPGGKGLTEVTAGTFETFAFRVSTDRFDPVAGRAVAGEDGKPVADHRDYRIDAGGRPVLWEIGGSPLRLEIRPASGAEGTPIGTVSAFLAAMAAKDEQALLRLVEWDAVFAEWSRGPGAAELAGKSEQEIAAIRDSFPPAFVRQMVAGVSAEQAKSLASLANPVFWVAEPQEGGDVLVRMSDTMLKRTAGQVRFRFSVRRTAERACQIVGFPPSK